jgi:hypothetical protein
MRGVSDIIGIINGKFFACECKVPGKKPSKDQADFLAEVARKGGIACWVTSVEELEQDLNEVLESDRETRRSPSCRTPGD